MKIQILGTGCAKCNSLAEQAKAAADKLGLDYELVKVTNLGEIASFGVMMTPALAIDGEVKLAGKVPGAAELEKILGAAG
jgi:small redox-active disulfide protein 2